MAAAKAKVHAAKRGKTTYLYVGREMATGGSPPLAGAGNCLRGIARAGIAGTGRYDRPGAWNADQTCRSIRYSIARIIMRGERNGSNGENELRAIAPRACFGIRGGFTAWGEKGKSEGDREEEECGQCDLASSKSERMSVPVRVARFRRSRGTTRF
jgi:hypothetical protein